MIVHADVDLCDFHSRDVADYVASNDRIWEMAVKEREAVLYRRGQGDLANTERAWLEAMRDGLIRGLAP